MKITVIYVPVFKSNLIHSLRQQNNIVVVVVTNQLYWLVREKMKPRKNELSSTDIMRVCVYMHHVFFVYAHPVEKETWLKYYYFTILANSFNLLPVSLLL